MFEIQNSYIHRNENIDSYFVTFDQELNDEVVIKDKTIYVKGTESHINILVKTLQAADFILNTLNHSYDFIVRTNISTITHLDNLCSFLNSLPKENVYTGGTLETLRWQMQKYEVTETKQELRNAFFGLKYIQGTGIILSGDVLEKIVSMKDSIEYDIVDDVKLGIIIQTFFPEMYANLNNIPKARICYNQYQEDCVFMRNRTDERLLDLHRMRTAVQSFCAIDMERLSFEKVIHITYKNIDNLATVKQAWLDMNPSYRVELYDDSRCMDILNTYFGTKYCDIFSFIKDGPIKCDFFRLCVLYIFGGVYVDADIHPFIALDTYIHEDVELVTCISYNYDINKTSFNYNPHFIISKKYSVYLYDTIQLYEKYYDKKIPYSYWDWSICKLFDLKLRFDIQVDKSNIFVYKNQKFQFVIEKAIKNRIAYDFTNIKEEGKMKFDCADRVLCTFQDKIVLDNFSNKKFL